MIEISYIDELVIERDTISLKPISSSDFEILVNPGDLAKIGDTIILKEDTKLIPQNASITAFFQELRRYLVADIRGQKLSIKPKPFY